MPAPVTMIASLAAGVGVGQFASSVWRIAMLVPNANPGSVVLDLGALQEAIAKARRGSSTPGTAGLCCGYEQKTRPW